MYTTAQSRDHLKKTEIGAGSPHTERGDPGLPNRLSTLNRTFGKGCTFPVLRVQTIDFSQRCGFQVLQSKSQKLFHCEYRDIL